MKNKLESTSRPRLFKSASFALLGMSAGCASANGGDEQGVDPVPGAVRSYPVNVDTKAPHPPNAIVNTATGLLIGDPWKAGCPVNLCDLLTDWTRSLSGWSVGRLSTGEYIYLSAKDESSWFWRRGRDVEAVTEGRFDDWPDREAPDWVPRIDGYALKATKPIPLFEDVFVGLWRSTEGFDPRHVVALFKGQETEAIGFGNSGQQPCVIATVDAPVVAISASEPLHGVAWGVTLVLRPRGSDHISILGYSLFPPSLKCMEAPA